MTRRYLAVLLPILLFYGQPGGHGFKHKRCSYISRQMKPPYSLNESLSADFRARGFQANWVSGTEFVFTDRQTGDIVKYDMKTRINEIIAAYEVLEKHQEGMSLSSTSSDGQYILLRHGTKRVFRHSFLAKYVVLGIKSRQFHAVGDGRPLSLVRWSPVGNALAFVLGNDVYYKAFANSSEVQLTFSGVPGVIYNGVADWVYEEEVLSASSALWFSPEGRKLCYMSLNDTLVGVMTYHKYSDETRQYPELVTLRYPKPGTPNPNVSLNVVSLTEIDSRKPKATVLPAPVSVVTEDHILYVVTWACEDKLAAVWTNRRQNVSATAAYVFKEDLEVENIYLMHARTQEGGWVTPAKLLFDAEGRGFATVLSHGGGSAHVALVEAGVETQLSSDGQAATAVDCWDTAADIIYYTATGRGSPSQRHVYAVRAHGGGGEGGTCMTCHVLTPELDNCTFARAHFSTDCSHYALTCRGPDPPFVALFKTSGSQPGYLWEDNAELRAEVRVRSAPEQRTIVVELPGGFEATARLWLPPGADVSGSTKYPLLVHVYGAPGYQQVKDVFEVDFGTYLTTSRAVAYAVIDGRGCGYHRDELMFQLNRRLGTVEVDDQIFVTRKLQESLPYIDRNRTGIWGWSYGGYVTAMALAKDSGRVFRCGASVAPASNWLLYDSIYTERYMGLPSDNAAGYDAGDVTRLAARLRHKRFLLVHGTADDNVHHQHALQLARRLQQKNVLFEFMSYTDETHDIHHRTLHVFKTLDDFWMRCFGC